MEKKQTMVDFGIDEFDLGSLVHGRNSRYRHFKLYATSNHYGTMNKGHYTACCRDSTYEKWFYFDDESVTPVIDPNNIRSNAVYILFYSTID